MSVCKEEGGIEKEAAEPTWRQSERDKQTDRSTKWEAVEEGESPTIGHGK